MLGASPDSLSTVELIKNAAVQQLASKASQGTDAAERQRLPIADLEAGRTQGMADIGPATPPPATSLFRVGDLVALRSNPAQVMPVIEVIPGAGECRYRVFLNNTRAIYYESQLQALAEQG